MREKQFRRDRIVQDVQRGELVRRDLINANWESFYGTKYLVEAHIREVAASIDFVRTATNVSAEEKRAFFRAVNKNYGSSALCLSGGASFGYYQYVFSID